MEQLSGSAAYYNDIIAQSFGALRQGGGVAASAYLQGKQTSRAPIADSQVLAPERASRQIGLQRPIPAVQQGQKDAPALQPRTPLSLCDFAPARGLFSPSVEAEVFGGERFLAGTGSDEASERQIRLNRFLREHAGQEILGTPSGVLALPAFDVEVESVGGHASIADVSMSEPRDPAMMAAEVAALYGQNGLMAERGAYEMPARFS